MKTTGDQTILPELCRVCVCGTSHAPGSVLRAEKAVPRGIRHRLVPQDPQGRAPCAQPATTAPEDDGVNAGKKGGVGAQRRRHCTPVELESFRGSSSACP